MGGFNPPVPQQDSNWEIRVAVLLSLLLQVVLIFLGPTRKRRSGPLPRIAVWSCYLLADWVADLTLGLLLNNMGSIGGGGGSSSVGLIKRGGDGTAGNDASTGSSSSPIIFAFWTPFLLLHLGGPDTITAYSVEDNELWFRHLVGLLFELVSAAVVFFCSLRGNPVIHATVLVFVAGIIKYGERTYSLYRGSLERFRTDILGPADPGPNYARLMTESESKEKAGLNVEIAIPDDGEASKAQKEMEDHEVARLVSEDKNLELRAYEFSSMFRRLFVDLDLGFMVRRLSRAFLLEREDMTPHEAFEVIEMELNFIYDMVYTKAPVAHTRVGWVLRSICSGCLVAALVIFFRHHKSGFKGVDVGITYALLLGGLALDVAALAMIVFSDRAAVFLQQSRRFRWLAAAKRRRRRRRTRRWSGTTSQLNLIRYCLGTPDYHYSTGGRCWWHWHRVRVAKMLCDYCVEAGILDNFLFIRQVPLGDLTDPWHPDRRGHPLAFVFYGVQDVARAVGQVADAYDKKKKIMEVCNRRGQGAIWRFENDIKQAGVGEDNFQIIMDSVDESRREFDESLLLWHVATDLCRLRGKQGPRAKETLQFRAISKTLSEYMLYLLIKQPDMLAATAGIGLLRYRDTRTEAQRFFNSKAAWNPDHNHEDARSMLLNVNTTRRPAEVKGDRSKSVLFDAVILAKALRALDEDLMWEVVQRVWFEMLTYAAAKCRGTTHVRQLSRGGELLTLVWFLMENMGLSEMYQVGQEKERVAKLIVRY